MIRITHLTPVLDGFWVGVESLWSEPVYDEVTMWLRENGVLSGFRINSGHVTFNNEPDAILFYLAHA